ncbi:MAG: flagellar biosynthetic protein FliQ [Bacillota bacterium]|nr:flagellar biosynthetic protein FliQ [Bacillota bacterium]
MQAAMLAGFKVAAPILVVSIAVGSIIAIFQAATQIHEQSLTFVPKLIAIFVILLLLGPWMIQTLRDFTFYIFGLVSKLG